jgi:transcription antitermination factor NusG
VHDYLCLEESRTVTLMAVAWSKECLMNGRSSGRESLSTLGHSSVRLPWFALHVRARHEAGVAAHLQGMGYEDFLPLCKTRTRWSDRTKEVETPLFPGYLFCRFDPQNRLPILKTPGVIQLVGYSRLPIAVEETEIEAIQALVASGLPSQPWPYLEVGEKVCIESGPLSGRQGVVLEFKGSKRLILSIALLQRSVAVEIEAWAVRPERSIASRLETTLPPLERSSGVLIA